MIDNQPQHQGYNTLSEFAIYLLVALFFAGCKTSSHESKDTIVNLSSFFTELRTAQTQNFRISNETDTTLHGQFGTKVYFPAYCLIDSNGNVTKEIVDVRLIEAYNPGQMIVNGLSTVTDKGQLLTTDGMIYLSASIGGGELQVSDTIPMKVSFRKSERYMDVTFNLYEGIESDDGVIWIDEPIGAEISEESLESLPEEIESQLHVPDSIRYKGSLFYRLYEVRTFGWLNVDILQPEERESLVSFTIETGTSLHQSIYFFVHDSRSSMFQRDLYPDDKGELVFPSLTKATSADIYAFYHDGEDYYYYHSSVVLNPNQKLKIDYRHITEDELIQLLDNIIWEEEI
jgi:hypothetical protein